MGHESIGVKREWVHLGVIYGSRLNEKFKKAYTTAHLYISTDGEYIRAHLISNWNSTYDRDETLRIDHYGGSALHAMRYFTEDWD